MVTWTFDLLALFIGWAVGMLTGCAIVALVELRDGGAWSKGFFDGCDKKHLIDYLNREKEEWKKKREE